MKTSWYPVALAVACAMAARTESPAGIASASEALPPLAEISQQDLSPFSLAGHGIVEENAHTFFTTPASGLQDLYFWIGAPLPGEINAKLTYHHFLTDTQRAKLGDAGDVSLGWQLSMNASALLKAALLTGNDAQPDLTRVSCEIDYSF